MEFFLQVWNENASRNGTAQRPDGHEEPDGKDGEESDVVEPAVRVARDEFVEEGCARALHECCNYKRAMVTL